MNIEDEEMNFLPAGSKIDVFKIEKIKDLKNITEAGDVKGQPKILLSRSIAILEANLRGNTEFCNVL